MKKKKLVLVLISLFLASLIILSPSVLAQGKDGIAHLVQQHSVKIANLEKAIKALNKESTKKETVSKEVKKALLQEANDKVKVLSELWNGTDFKVDDIKLKEVDGELVMQFYTTGKNDWTSKPNTTENWGVGRVFAGNFVGSFDSITLLYDVELKYEFYENGKQVKMFTSLK